MIAMRRFWSALALLLLAAGISLAAWGLWRSARGSDRRTGTTSSARSPSWPDRAAALHALGPSFPKTLGRRRVLLDPGHGAAGNTGNLSCTCEPEQDYTLALALQLAFELEATGHFEIRLTRAAGELVDYASRVQQASSWKAEAFVSLHSDVRGRAEPAAFEAGQSCSRTDEEPGFAVLWSDEAGPALLPARMLLARALGTRLRETGLLPYDGVGYHEQYEADSSVPGVFMDRHASGQRIFVLRAPTMASVIIETHNAWNDLEAERWHEPATRQAFGTAVAAALADALTAGDPESGP